MTQVNDWRDRFKSNMTRVTFTLSLTRAMLEFLCAASDDVYWDRRAFGGLGYPDNFLATEHALMRRGLLVRLPPREVTGRNISAPPWSLTPAGVQVVQLLKVGGIYIEAEEARQRFASRKGRK